MSNWRLSTCYSFSVLLEHDDLHGGNVLVGPDGDRFFDWGDAVVAHPFGTLTVTFNSIAHKLELPAEDPAFARLEAVYLEAWDGVAPRADLRRAAAITRVLGCIGRALAWERVAQRARGWRDGRLRRRCRWMAGRIRRPAELPRRYSMTSPAGRSAGSGYCGSSSSSVSARIDATARSRNHFRLAGITYHGARSVDVFDSASSKAAMVVVPVLALLEIAERELPALCRVVVARLEPLALLVLVDVQEELHDGRAAGGQVLFERVDLVVASPPDVLRNELVDADDEDVLVVRAIEDADLAPGRDALVDRATGSRGRAPRSRGP